MPSDVSPTARALLTLELLQGSPGIRAEELARRLGVTERAARRYVGILREAGIPVESTRGPYGGYRLGRGLRLPPLTFSASEALGLVMAVLDGHHAAADHDDPVGSALGKLIRALPEPVAAQAATVRRHAAAAPDRAAARPDPATTTALVQAVAEHRQVELHYRTARGSDLVVTVDPWAVVVRHGRWYLLCFAHSVAAIRTYRIDHVRRVTELPGTFRAPEDLDPVAVLEENLGLGWEYETEFVIDLPLQQARQWLPRAAGRAEAVDDHTTRVRGSTSELADYVAQLARIPVSYRVVGGPELRAAMRELAARLTAAGAEPGPPPD